MTRFVCNDYGFECGYEVEGKSLETLEKFGKHSREEHGIEYSDGSLLQFLIRKAEKDPDLLEIDLTEDMITTIISILDFSCTACPISQLNENIKIDHGLIQRIILRLLEKVMLK